mgnify:CR=1 FL=1
MTKVTKTWVKDMVRKLPDTVNLKKGDSVKVNILCVIDGDWDSVRLDVRTVQVGRLTGSALQVQQSDLDERLLLITSYLPYKNYYPNGKRLTYSDLETILYSYFNKVVEQVINQYGPKAGQTQDEVDTNDVYVAVTGYGAVRAIFYVKVKETDKSVWLVQLGKQMAGPNEDRQNGRVVPNLMSIPDTKPMVKRKRDDGSIKINKYLTAHPWSGEAIQEYSD